MEVRHGSGTGMAEVCSASKGVVGRWQPGPIGKRKEKKKTIRIWNWQIKFIQNWFIPKVTFSGSKFLK
jgi:hypothetical protein